MKEYNNEAVSIGDCFLVESGANASGKKGEQLAVVTKKTAKHVFCHKLSLRQKLSYAERRTESRPIGPARSDGGWLL
jgi:hypothetical protein